MRLKPFHIPSPLRSRIGQPVSFGPPDDVLKAGGGRLSGIVVDELWADPVVNARAVRPSSGAGDWGDYSFCAQRIRWSDGSYSIRLGYYRRRAGEDGWHWGSQTTVHRSPTEMKAFLDAVLSQKQWFESDPPV
jgi:hypothetical protein